MQTTASLNLLRSAWSLFLGITILSTVAVQTPLLRAEDQDAAPLEGEETQDLYNVIIAFEFGGFETILASDGTARLTTGEPLGLWDGDEDGTNLTIESAGSSLELTGIIGAELGEIGAATLSVGGGNAAGFWGVSQIHSVATGSTLFNPEFADGFELTGEFELETVDEEDRYTAMEDECEVEVFMADGTSEVIEISAGCQVFWRVSEGQSYGLVVAIQDPQGKGKLRKRKVQNPQIPIAGPTLYAKGAWLSVIETPVKSCMVPTATPPGGKCSNPATNCEIQVYVPGNPPVYKHKGGCGGQNPDFYRENASGSLYVSF